MLEAKTSGLHLYIERCGLLSDVICSVSFKAKLNSCLHKLRGGCECDCHPQGLEEACLCYALYLQIKLALAGDPLAMSRSKVSDVHCNSNNGYFSISWKVKGTGSAVRKSIGIALKQLSPCKVYAGYSNCVREAHGKVDREVFNHIASELTKSIREELCIGVVGGIRLKKKDPQTKSEIDAINIKEMLDVLVKKVALPNVEGSKSAPKDFSECKHDDKTEVKVSGLAAFYLKDYLMSKVKGMCPMICDKQLVLNIAPSRWETIRKKVRDGMKDYVDQKYSKLADNLTSVLCYMSMSTASVSSVDCYHALKNGVTAQKVKDELSAVL